MIRFITKNLAWLLFALAAITIIVLSCLYVKAHREIKSMDTDYVQTQEVCKTLLYENKELKEQNESLARQDSILQVANKGLADSVTALRKKCDELQKSKSPRKTTRKHQSGYTYTRPSQPLYQSYPDLGW